MCHHLQSVSCAAKYRRSTGKNWGSRVTLTVSLVKIDFGFKLIKIKKIDCIMDLYIVKYVFTEIRHTRIWRADFTTVSLQNYFSVIIWPIITNSPNARYLKSKHSWQLYLLYSISGSNLWLTLSSPWRLQTIVLPHLNIVCF